MLNCIELQDHFSPFSVVAEPPLTEFISALLMQISAFSNERPPLTHTGYGYSSSILIATNICLISLSFAAVAIGQMPYFHL
jgi:hypothetical protein